MLLLSVKAGLRAGEIMDLTWAWCSMPTAISANASELPDSIAKA